MFEKKQVRCPNCGCEGPVKRIVKGSFIIEISLYLIGIFFFIIWIPAIIYSLWRITSQTNGCAACGWAHVVQIAK